METKTNIGIIGNGFVGSAIAHGFSLWANLRIFDRDPRLSTDSLVSVIQNSEIIFVCVPTPMDASNGNKILSWPMCTNIIVVLLDKKPL